MKIEGKIQQRILIPCFVNYNRNGVENSLLDERLFLEVRDNFISHMNEDSQNIPFVFPKILEMSDSETSKPLKYIQHLSCFRKIIKSLNFEIIEDSVIILMFYGYGSTKVNKNIFQTFWESIKGLVPTYRIKEGFCFKDDNLFEDELNNMIAPLSASNDVYVIIDACYSGGMSFRENNLYSRPINRAYYGEKWQRTKCQIFAFYSTTKKNGSVYNIQCRLVKRCFTQKPLNVNKL